MLKNTTLQTIATIIVGVFLCNFSFAQRNGQSPQKQELIPTNTKTIQAFVEAAAELEATQQSGGDVFGCTDITACNYLSFATIDDGSCCFDNCYTLSAFQGGIGGPLGKGVLGGGELQWSITQNGQVVEQGFSNFASLCLEDGCYELNIPFASGYQISLFPGNGIILAKGGGAFNSSIEVDFSGANVGAVSFPFSVNGECPAGCTSAQACNYDPTAFFDDGSCEFPGCCDPAACNYEASATCPGACFYDDACGVCGGTEFGVEGFSNLMENGALSANTGDGNGNVLNLSDYIYITGSNEDGDILLAKSQGGGGIPGEGPLTYIEIAIPQTGEYSFDWSYFTEDSPVYDIAFYAIDNGIDLPVFSALTVDFDGELVQNGSATLFLNEGETLWIGIDSTDDCCGAGYLTLFNFLSPAPECLAGCTNSNSCNFDVSAVFDDGSCIPSACDDIFAVNYDPQGNCGGGMCYYVNPCGTLVDEDGNTFGFTGYYASPNWTISADDANATVNVGPEQMVLVGADDEGNPITSATIAVGATGTVSFDWSYSTSDVSASLDIAYYINGVQVVLSDVGGALQQNGSVSFEANSGDIIGFEIDATDACCGFATLIISDFQTAGGECSVSCEGDFNGDGVVNSTDLLTFLAVFGTLCF